MSEMSTQDQVYRKPQQESDVAALLVLGRLDGEGTSLGIVRLDGELMIGRGQGGVLAGSWEIDDETVSRRHALVRLEAGDFFLEDAGSRNGTWLNGKVLRREKARLGNGALILLGGEVAVFRRMTEEQISAIEVEQERPLGPVPTASPVAAVALRRLRILAGTDRPVLLAGETGTGKEVYARAVHDASGRRGPFMALNCASFNRELFESHLFGYKRGSHSQASEDHVGVLASAEGGTVFLDEIGEMDVGLQTKLLRFLQDKTFLGLGWTRPRQADVRIIAATQSPQSSLRKDVLARLGAEPVVLPALRRRREDLPALCRHFLRRLPENARLQGLERNASISICIHTWPQNVRELEATLAEGALSAVERGVERIDLQDLPTRIRDLVRRGGKPQEDPESRPADAVVPPRRDRPTRGELEELLREHRGHVPAVARQLDRRRELIWRWCRLDGIDPNAFKDGSPDEPESGAPLDQTAARRSGDTAKGGV